MMTRIDAPPEGGSRCIIRLSLASGRTARIMLGDDDDAALAGSARIVNGYAPGEFVEDATYRVRANNAHTC